MRQPLVFAKPAEGSRAATQRQNTGRARRDEFPDMTQSVRPRAARSNTINFDH
jgi:hypothetical protein